MESPSLSFRAWVLAAICLAPAACSAAPHRSRAEWSSRSVESQELQVQVVVLGTDLQERPVPLCAGCHGPIVNDRFVHETWCPYYEPEPTAFSIWWRSAKEVVLGILVIGVIVFYYTYFIRGIVYAARHDS